MKNRKYFGLAALLAAMLAFVGCEDFESDLAYDVSFGETTYEIVGINEDNSVKVKILTEVIVDTLVNETMNNSTIELDGEVCHADVEHVSDSIYLLSATFDQVPLRKSIYVISEAKGNYLNTRTQKELYISGVSFVKVSDIQTLAVGPDSVSLQVSLNDFQYMNSGEYLDLTVVMERNGETYDDNTMRFFPSEIRDGKVLMGFVTRAPAGNYTLKVSNPVVSTEAYSKSVQVNVPAPTATITNLQYSIDEMGMHITGNVDRGNLLCNPQLLVKGTHVSLCHEIASDPILVEGIYPLYNTPVTISITPVMKNGQRLGSVTEFSFKSTFKRYAVDLGGNVYWSVYNEGATNGNYNGERYELNRFEQDGYWRLPSCSEYEEMRSNTYAGNGKKTTKYGVKGAELESKVTGNTIFFPTPLNSGGNYYASDYAYYWLQNSERYYYYAIYGGDLEQYDYDYYNYTNTYRYARYVRPKNPVRVTAINLSKSSVNTYVGNTINLTATLVPENADAKSLSYSSSNPEVATVSSTGAVTAHKVGQCVITVSSVEKDVNATCVVNVEEGFVDLGLSVKWCALNQGASENSDLGNNMYGNTAVSEYRVPTTEQYQELLDNCTKTKVYVNGVEGWRFTAPNGNSIFLPVTSSGYWTNTYNSYKYKGVYYGTVYYLSVNKATGPEILKDKSDSYSSESYAISAAWQKAYRYVREVKQ